MSSMWEYTITTESSLIYKKEITVTDHMNLKTYFHPAELLNELCEEYTPVDDKEMLLLSPGNI